MSHSSQGRYLRPPRVVVAGANSQTGRLLLLLLRDSGVHATALVRQAVTLPANDIINDWTNDPRAVDAIQAADAVVLLTGVLGAAQWQHYQHGMVDTAHRVACAVTAAGTQPRVVYFSSLLADAASDNWYLKAKGMAEQVLLQLPGTVIFRLGPVVRGSPQPLPFERALLQPGPHASVLLPGDPQRVSRPIHLGDVVTVAEAAALGAGPAGIHELGGPSEHSLAELAHLANGGEVSFELAQQPVPCPHATRDLAARIATPRDATALAATLQAFSLRLTPLSLAWPLDAVEL